MSFLQRAAVWLGLREDAPASNMLPGITPGGGLTLEWVTADKALSLSAVFRAAQVLATSGQQLSIDMERGGKPIPSPSLVKKPSLKQSRSAFVGESIISMALNGNCFWKLNRTEPTAEVNDMEVLPPEDVYVGKDYETGRIVYSYKGKVLQPWEIHHLQFLRIPGKLRGLGPIQAARADLKAALDTRDYAANWFTDTDEPTGILTSDQDLNAEKASRYSDAFQRKGDFAPKEGKKRSIRVLGAGLKYESLFLSPADVQFLESQQFSTTQIARLFGIPASLQLAAVEGTSTTYSNIEQDSIIFIRYTLMAYLREIEEAFTEITARGQVARFNLSALLRADTKTRYEAHKIALDWMDDDEIRAIEGLPPFTAEQRARRDARQAKSAPAEKVPSGN